MMRRDGMESGAGMTADAYRAAAHADADAHFDDRALEAQRQRILQRIEQAGRGARVIRFPGVPVSLRSATHHSRRWISAAAAAGLLIGLLTGQLLHVLPGDNWVHRDAPRTAAAPPVPAAGRMTIVPALATSTFDADDALLDAIDAAVSAHGVSDLRALDDLTFAYEPR